MVLSWKRIYVNGITCYNLKLTYHSKSTGFSNTNTTSNPKPGSIIKTVLIDVPSNGSWIQRMIQFSWSITKDLMTMLFEAVRRKGRVYTTSDGEQGEEGSGEEDQEKENKRGLSSLPDNDGGPQWEISQAGCSQSPKGPKCLARNLDWNSASNREYQRFLRSEEPK